MLSSVTPGIGLGVLPGALKHHRAQCPPELWAGPLARGVREGLAAQQRVGRRRETGCLSPARGEGRGHASEDWTHAEDWLQSHWLWERTQLLGPRQQDLGQPPSPAQWLGALRPGLAVSGGPCGDLACSPHTLCSPCWTWGQAEWYCGEGLCPSPLVRSRRPHPTAFLREGLQ